MDGLRPNFGPSQGGVAQFEGCCNLLFVQQVNREEVILSEQIGRQTTGLEGFSCFNLH